MVIMKAVFVSEVTLSFTNITNAISLFSACLTILLKRYHYLQGVNIHNEENFKKKLNRFSFFMNLFCLSGFVPYAWT